MADRLALAGAVRDDGVALSATPVTMTSTIANVNVTSNQPHMHYVSIYTGFDNKLSVNAQ